ncbi:MAG: recombinase family protein, partial [Clostridiaceae bacterium]|nr:recombinase family protein [Clostridiaceae bacterium]
EQVKGTSLENQDELCRAYCQNKGIEVLEIFREEGASAKTAHRAEFLRAIEYCRKNKGKVDAFVVYKVDRFARNTEDHFYVRKMLIEYGVTLHSVTEPIGNNPAEKFIETVLAGSAEFDNAVRTQRAIDGMAMKINQGISPFKPPLGYNCPHARSRGEKKTEPDMPDEEIFPIIQKGLQKFSTGLYSQAELLRYFDKLGLSKITGKKTQPQLISRILGKSLKFYAGIIFNPWTREEVKGLHQPMITKEEYFRIRMILTGKIIRVKREKFNPIFPLRGTVKCGSCGKLLTGSCSRGRNEKYAYYHCYNKECPMYGKAISKLKLESEFINYLNGITPKKDFLELFEATVLSHWDEMISYFEAEAQKYTRYLNVLDGKRKRIFEMREEGSYTPDEFRERKEEIENTIMVTKISLDETRIEEFDIKGALSYTNNFISNLGRQWFDLSESRSRFQKLVFPEGISYCRGEGFGTAPLGLIYELNRTCGTKKSVLVRHALISWNLIMEELRKWQDLKKVLEPQL